MEAILSRPVWPPKNATLRDFQNWVLCWIILPNFGFWLLWIVGGPDRFLEILVTGCVGLALHRAPFPVRLGAFIVALVFSTLSFIAGMFNLGIRSLVESVKFASELNPVTSPQYVIAALAVTVTLCFAWRLLQRPATLDRPILLVAAMALTMMAASFDHWFARNSRGHYKHVPQAGAPFTSASKASGLRTIATGDRHVVMIMVESMGLPTDPAVRRRLDGIWARPEVRARYDVTVGDTLYYGSTTSGEIRELCGRWGDYQELLKKADGDCLPTTLAAKGYQSQAWHSFTGEFFDRKAWYPNIGFTQMRFGDRLMADGAAICPGVFVGACDWAVPAQMARTLKAADKRQFLYWLTVNSHLPVLEDERLGTKECAGFDAALDRDFPMMCRLHQIFDRTGQALAKEITASDFPATDILIVGDHIPPFFDRHHRTQFAPDRVPWILLKAKRAPMPGFGAI
jgi:hypothetical protein